MTFRRALLLATFVLCTESLQTRAQRTEKFRPQYHFSPNSGWIGDPDGLVHYQGLYHLFWWGHATSSDLVHWSELPYPIQGDNGSYQVTTGSSVIDTNNNASLGSGRFINFHTLVPNSAGAGAAGIGLSTNLDTTARFPNFSLYAGNPILNPPTSGDFRDPQVFWHPQSSSWIMIVAGGMDKKIYFYRSGNLINWTPSGSFASTNVSSNSCNDDIWETPDLFQLPVDGSSTNTKWVLSIGVRNRMCYLVGDFNGSTFLNAGSMLTTDTGPDFYSARTWRDYDNPPGRITMLGWMGNWTYSTVSPSRATYGGTGAMSIPRDLSLTTYPEGIRLVQTPIAALQQQRQSAQSISGVPVTGTHAITDFVAFKPSQNSYEMDATFTITSPAVFGFNLLVDHSQNRSLVIQYDPSSSTLSVDRTHSYAPTGISKFDINFPEVVSTSVPPVNNQIELHIFIDKSSVEIFSNSGKTVMTLLTYPEDPQPGIEVFANNGNTTLASFTGWELNSIWSGSPTNRIQTGGIYKVVARHDGKVLDDPQVMDTQPLQQYSDLGGPNQHWKIDLLELGHYDSGNTWVPPYYGFTNQGNGDAVDLRGGSTSNGTVVQQYHQVANDDNQRWQIEEIGGGFFEVISKASAPNSAPLHQSMEVQSTSTGEGTGNGQPIQTWQFLAYPHQEWQFVLVPPSQ